MRVTTADPQSRGPQRTRFRRPHRPRWVWGRRRRQERGVGRPRGGWRGRVSRQRPGAAASSAPGCRIPVSLGRIPGIVTSHANCSDLLGFLRASAQAAAGRRRYQWSPRRPAWRRGFSGDAAPVGVEINGRPGGVGWSRAAGRLRVRESVACATDLGGTSSARGSRAVGGVRGGGRTIDTTPGGRAHGARCIRRNDVEPCPVRDSGSPHRGCRHGPVEDVRARQLGFFWRISGRGGATTFSILQWPSNITPA